MRDQENSTINRYLLGELPPEEASALEARLMTESGLFELAEAVEDEVVDRYVRGEMSRQEARRFERRLLPSERIRERVAFARALAAHGTARPMKRKEAEGARVIPLFRSPVRLAWAATLVAVLAAGALAVEVVRLRDQAGVLERAHGAAVAELQEAQRERAPQTEQTKPASPAVEVEAEPDPEVVRLADELSAARDRIAELEAQEAATPERRVRRPGEIGDDVEVSSLFLALGVRSGATLPTLELGDAAVFELQIDLGVHRPEGPMAATVLRGDVPVWRKTGIPIETYDDESIVVLKVPRESLFAGSYKIRLTTEAGTLPESPEFSVTP